LQWQPFNRQVVEADNVCSAETPSSSLQPHPTVINRREQSNPGDVDEVKPNGHNTAAYGL